MANELAADRVSLFSEPSEPPLPTHSYGNITGAPPPVTKLERTSTSPTLCFPVKVLPGTTTFTVSLRNQKPIGASPLTSNLPPNEWRRPALGGAPAVNMVC